MAALDTVATPRAKQTYDALRARIASSACGVPLPSVAEIRSELGVSQDTVAKAFAVLEQEGLIERKRRKGVFVADPLKRTGEIAIVLSQVHLSKHASPFYARQCAHLRQQLHAVNPRWTVKLHLGVSTVPGPDLPVTLDLLDPTVLPRLRGVLSFVGLFEVGVRLAEAGVSVVYFAAQPTSNAATVCLDHDQMLRDGIRHLADVGCRNVCLLSTRYIGTKPVGRDPVPVAAAAAAACGLRFRNEWIGHEEGGWGERHGYDLFMRVWDQGARPDGVLVSDDVLCHGVLRAIQERQVNLPRDLRLVTNANRGFDFPYPRPVSRVEFDLDVMADKAVRMLETLCKGQKLKQTVERVRPVLVKGETT